MGFISLAIFDLSNGRMISLPWTIWQMVTVSLTWIRVAGKKWCTITCFSLKLGSMKRSSMLNYFDMSLDLYLSNMDQATCMF